MYGYGYAYLNNPQGNGLIGRYEAGVRSDGGSFAFPIDTGLASRLEGLGLLNASSLVNSCNAGKESVLYNLVPTPASALDRFTVTRSTTKWVLGANGVLTEIPANFPAFEFNTDGTYRGLLVEPAATNLLQYSEQLDNAVWGKTALSVSANALVSPSGATTADVLIPNTTSALHFHTFAGANQTSFTSGVTYTVSVFLKRSGYDFFSIQTNNAAFGSFFENRFDLANGTVVFAQNTATITAFPNGWYKCTVTATATATITTGFGFGIVRNGNNTSSYAGDGVSGVGIFGYQLETGSVATSYIPTTASTANRTADSVTLTGASSLIGQSAGTAFVEFESRIDGVSTRILTLDDGSSTNNFRIAHLNTSAVFYGVTVGGVGQASITSAGTYTGVIKASFAYATNDFVAYVNGASIGTDASGAVPATSRIIIGYSGAGTDYLNSWIRSVALFPTRLSNSQLATLTT